MSVNLTFTYNMLGRRRAFSRNSNACEVKRTKQRVLRCNKQAATIEKQSRRRQSILFTTDQPVQSADLILCKEWRALYWHVVCALQSECPALHRRRANFLYTVHRAQLRDVTATVRACISFD